MAIMLELVMPNVFQLNPVLSYPVLSVLFFGIFFAVVLLIIH